MIDPANEGQPFRTCAAGWDWPGKCAPAAFFWTAAIDKVRCPIFLLLRPTPVRLPEGDERAYRLLGRPIPQAIPIRLIIDTGAKRSSLVPQVLNQLAPTSASRATVETGLGMRQTELYWVSLEFMAGTLAAVPRLAVARLPLPSSLQEYHGLMGRDVLSMWYSLLYEGRRAQLTIRDSRAGFFRWFES